MKKNWVLMTAFLVLLFSGIILSSDASALTAADSASEKKSASLGLYQAKLGDGSHLIRATVSSVTEDGRIFLRGMKVKFLGGMNQDVTLGEAVTNEKGIAVFTVPKVKLPPGDEEGTFTYGASFEGNDQYEAASDQISIKDLTIEVTTLEEDSVKSVTATVFEVTDKGEKIPVTACDVFFYVPRMFSYMKVGEGSLDSTGVVAAEFPADLPSDSTGMLTVIARIEDHELYGNVEGMTKVKWGIPKQLFVKGSYRALWSQVAPTWMVVTLIILLLGVWGHYGYAVYKLIKIKKEARKLQNESESKKNQNQ